jgi:hypothetical protein
LQILMWFEFGASEGRGVVQIFVQTNCVEVRWGECGMGRMRERGRDDAALTPGPSPKGRGEIRDDAALTAGPSPKGRGEIRDDAALTPGPSPKGRGR